MENDTGAPLDMFGERNDFTMMPARRDYDCTVLTVERGEITGLSGKTGTGPGAMLRAIGQLARDGAIPSGWGF